MGIVIGVMENYDHTMPIFEENEVTVEIWLKFNLREDLEKILNVLTGKADLLDMPWSGQEKLVASRLLPELLNQTLQKRAQDSWGSSQYCTPRCHPNCEGPVLILRGHGRIPSWPHLELPATFQHWWKL